MAADKSLVDDLTREFVAESQEGLDRMEQCLGDLEARPGDRGLIDEIFRSVHTIKGATGFLGFVRLEALAHAGEDLLSSLRSGKIAITPDVVNGLLELLDALRNVLRLIELTGGEGQRSSDEDFSTIGRLIELHEAGLIYAELGSIASAGNADLPGKLTGEGHEDEHDDRVKRADRAEQRAAAHAAEKTLRVDLDVLNRLMNLVSQLVLTRNQILRLAPAEDQLGEAARRLDTVTTDLRDTVMRARLQPVGHLFGKFPRLVRDLAGVCGKLARIEFSGQETGLDKTLLEVVRDPLTHAVRNALDHGIELPEERLRLGKNAEGVLRLRAQHRDGSVVIELEDDGAGIPVDRVTAKAVECGLISPEQAAGMSEHDRMQLIFAPGFSTAEQVTSVSGRGVGMDVIRENLEKARGSVEVKSRAGAGTVVRLTLPLTVAIVPALILRTAGQSFAVPQNAVRELHHVSSADLAIAVERVGNGEIYHGRGYPLPLIRLHCVLGLFPACEGLGAHIAVLEHDGFRFGLLVDEVAAPEEIVVKPLSPALRADGLFAGAATMGCGGLALMLDAAWLKNRAAMCGNAAAHEIASEANASVERAYSEPALVCGIRVDGKEGTALTSCSIPVRAVDHIDVISRQQIEEIEQHLAMRRGEEILEIVDEGNIWSDARQLQMTVVWCNIGNRKVGFLVDSVLEIAERTPGEQKRDSGLCAGGYMGNVAELHAGAITG